MGSTVVDKTEKNLSSLEQLLGTNVVEDVKQRIGDLIVDRVRSDIEAYDCYLFYPEDYKGEIDESFGKVGKKISKMYADAMLETAEEAVHRFKDIALTTTFEQPGIVLRSCHKCEHCDFNKCKFYNDYYWKAHDGICAKEGFIQYKKKEN
ncbi:MAG: hypothetical protein ACLTWK_00550 [Eisenbergiella sp.]